MKAVYVTRKSRSQLWRSYKKLQIYQTKDAYKVNTEKQGSFERGVYFCMNLDKIYTELPLFHSKYQLHVV